jgi:hypothetical protein
MTWRLMGAPETAQDWHRIAPEVQRALDHSLGEIGAQDAFERLMEGLLLLATDDKSYALLELQAAPQMNILHVLTYTGTWDDGFVDFLMEGARFNRAKYITMLGRKGWSRKLKHLGAREETRLALEVT